MAPTQKPDAQVDEAKVEEEQSVRSLLLEMKKMMVTNKDLQTLKTEVTKEVTEEVTKEVKKQVAEQEHAAEKPPTQRRVTVLYISI